MIGKKTTLILSVLLIFVSFCIFFSSCKDKSMDGMIVFTQVGGKIHDPAYLNGGSWRYFHQARIVALYPEKKRESLKILTSDFYSARSPEISCDGRFMLFAAQQKQNDPWQIWEMNLEYLRARKITSSSENCIDPAYLPLGRMIFSRLVKPDSVNADHSLFTCKLDGSDIRQITFNPSTYFATSVLKDGRILSVSRQFYPSRGDGKLMVLRPDGTKSELFYESVKGSILFNRAWETVNGKILFIESDTTIHAGGNIISISYTRPMHSRVDLTSGVKGDFYSIFPMQSGKLLVSYRLPDSDMYELYSFDPENKTLGNVIYENDEYNALEAVVIEKHERQKKLPSEVDMGVKTGLLLCQDVNLFETQSSADTSACRKAEKIEILGVDSTFGMVKVRKDGSFYLKILADTPFRIQTLDANGNVVHGPSAWIWLRPNERRGCAGCHEDHELTPDNRMPFAVKRPPVSVPVHVSAIVEKEVELE